MNPKLMLFSSRELVSGSVQGVIGNYTRMEIKI